MRQFDIGIRHPGGVRFNFAAWENQDCTIVLQVSNDSADHLHASHRVGWVRRKDSVSMYIRQILKKRNFTDDDFIVAPWYVSRDHYRINRSWMIRGNNERSHWWNIFNASGRMSLYKSREEPARSSGKPILFHNT